MSLMRHSGTAFSIRMHYTHMRRIKPAISALRYNILLQQARRSTRNICNAAVRHSLIAHYLLDVPAEFCSFAALAQQQKRMCARRGWANSRCNFRRIAKNVVRSWSVAMCPLHEHRNVEQRDHKTYGIPRKNTWPRNPLHFINTQ